jgi:hypothetical protein
VNVRAVCSRAQSRLRHPEGAYATLAGKAPPREALGRRTDTDSGLQVQDPETSPEDRVKTSGRRRQTRCVELVRLMMLGEDVEERDEDGLEARAAAVRGPRPVLGLEAQVFQAERAFGEALADVLSRPSAPVLVYVLELGHLTGAVGLEVLRP